MRGVCRAHKHYTHCFQCGLFTFPALTGGERLAASLILRMVAARATKTTHALLRNIEMYKENKKILLW
jgi:hypothetical protein